MRSISSKYFQYTVTQRFLIDRFIELCYHRSLDTYRARFNNSKSNIEELYKLIIDWKKNKIKDFSTILSCKEEVICHLETDECFSYGYSSKDYSIDSLKLLKSENEYDIINQIEYNLYHLIEVNINYVQNLFVKLEKNLIINGNTLKEITPAFIEINKYLGFLVTELINNGFSKSYLYKLIAALFKFKPLDSFEKSWSTLKELLVNKSEDIFCIIFQINGSEKQLNNIDISELQGDIDSKYKSDKFPKQVINYISPAKNKKFVYYEVKALDYYQALKISKNKLAILLDIIHLGYSNINLILKDTAVVINLSHVENSDLQPIHYQIDGYYKSNNNLYNLILQNLKVLNGYEYISPEVKDKIKSAIRYLRLGNEAIELEQKFINYWIGLEYIFSDNDINSHAFSRIKKYFVITHLNTYIKRNINNLHVEIYENNLDNLIEKFDDSLEYFIQPSSLDKIIANISNTPNISFKASQLKSALLGHSDKKHAYLKRHENNLTSHIVRLYRIRNELIHDAALIQNIENITGNLRYYLTFILNRSIDYFIACKPKPINEKLVIMNDFFSNQEMLWENLKKRNYPIDEFIKLPFSGDLFK